MFKFRSFFSMAINRPVHYSESCEISKYFYEQETCHIFLSTKCVNSWLVCDVIYS